MTVKRHVGGVVNSRKSNCAVLYKAVMALLYISLTSTVQDN